MLYLQSLLYLTDSGYHMMEFETDLLAIDHEYTVYGKEFDIGAKCLTLVQFFMTEIDDQSFKCFIEMKHENEDRQRYIIEEKIYTDLASFKRRVDSVKWKGLKFYVSELPNFHSVSTFFILMLRCIF